MHRFYCPDLKTSAAHAGLLDARLSPQAPPLPLPQPESRHALKVLRLPQGEEIEVFDGCGLVAKATLHVTSVKQAHIKVLSLTAVPQPQPHLAIASAMPKGSRVDWMVEQLSQLGVDLLIPLKTRYSVVDPRQSKLDRLRHAAIESAKQCRRAWIMNVDAPRSLSQFLARSNSLSKSATLRLIADPEGAPLPALEARSLTDIEVLIGPEGGWEDSERALAIAQGFKPWRLSPNVLRIETAAAAAAGILRAT